MGNPNPDSCPTLFFPGFPENIFLILKSQKEKGIVKHYTKKKNVFSDSQKKNPFISDSRMKYPLFPDSRNEKDKFWNSGRLFSLPPYQNEIISQFKLFFKCINLLIHCFHGNYETNQNKTSLFLYPRSQKRC